MVDRDTEIQCAFDANVVVTTNDGSSTLYNPSTGEHYHSMGGALTESRHVYINGGLLPVLACHEIVHVYEAGMGTGLNALLTSLEARKSKKHIHYHACDLFPVASGVASCLNYPDLVGDEAARVDFQAIHNQEWDEEPHRLHRYFLLSKYRRDFSQVTFFEEQLRVVYFDAFSSSSQPELWNKEMFSSLARAMLPGAILVTYATAGVVKEALRKAGFSVKRLQGAAGKREMLKAVKL